MKKSSFLPMLKDWVFADGTNQIPFADGTNQIFIYLFFRRLTFVLRGKKIKMPFSLLIGSASDLLLKSEVLPIM